MKGRRGLFLCLPYGQLGIGASLETRENVIRRDFRKDNLAYYFVSNNC